MHLNRLICLGYGLALACCSLLAQAEIASEPGHSDALSVSATLTLHDVLQKTFERNPDFQMLRALDSEVQARYAHAQATLPMAPAIALRHQNDALGSGRGEREWEAELELPVWLPGQKTARQNVANEAQAGLAASREGLLLQVSGLLRDALWDIGMNRNSAELADQRVATAKALLHDLEHRFRAGEMARTDVMLAQNEVLQAQAQQVRAQAELKYALHRYQVLTGLDTLPGNPEEIQSERSSLDGNALMSEADAKVTLMQSERELVRMERRENPQVMLSARTQRGAFDNAYNDSVGVSVRIPFSSEARNAPLLAQAEINLTRAMADRDRLKYTLETMLHEAGQNLEVARAELDIATRQQQIAKENLRLAQKAFDLGETDLVHLMRIQALAYEAERALGNCRIQLQWNIARYNQAVGVLP